MEPDTDAVDPDADIFSFFGVGLSGGRGYSFLGVTEDLVDVFSSAFELVCIMKASGGQGVQVLLVASFV